MKIGLIGDFNPTVTAHIAIPKALQLASDSLGNSVEAQWLATEKLPDQKLFRSVNAFWCVPASPYRSFEGALAAIRYARENQVPFLGTCGGFQHALIEYARNGLGLLHADHAESNPETSFPLINQLSCSLVEAEGKILFKRDSRIFSIYGRPEAIEKYHCSFGLNPKYSTLLRDSDLVITGFDQNGETRVFEHRNHPFFVGTLFQPERSALENRVHPLIAEFLKEIHG